MKILNILNIFALLGVTYGQTDCGAVYESWYGTTCEDEMTCSDNYACVVPDDCSAYQCVQNCPEGTDLLPFYPEGEPEQAGYACIPKEFQEEVFECNFGDAPDYTLSMNARVPGINKQHNWDEREITIIGYDTYEEYKASVSGPVFNLFDASGCTGHTNTNGDVIFENVQNGVNNCSFTNMGMETASSGIPYFTQKMVVGYDDLVDFLPNNQPVVKKYGKAWVVSCRIKAWETGYVNPGATGERDEIEVEIDTEIPFTVKMYMDDGFEHEYDGTPIDISADSIESQKIYVETKAEIPEGEGVNMIHVRHCKINQMAYNDSTDSWSDLSDTFDFIIDGCLNTADGTFVERNFEMKDQRIQFADSNAKTYIVDQFAVDLWNPNTEPTDNIKVMVECDMVACEVDEFSRTDEGYGPESFCWLNNDCRYDEGSRYSNLINSRVRQSRNEPATYDRSRLQHAKCENCFSYNLVEPTGSGDLKHAIALSLFTFM